MIWQENISKQEEVKQIGWPIRYRQKHVVGKKRQCTDQQSNNRRLLFFLCGIVILIVIIDPFIFINFGRLIRKVGEKEQFTSGSMNMDIGIIFPDNDDNDTIKLNIGFENAVQLAQSWLLRENGLSPKVHFANGREAPNLLIESGVRRFVDLR
jgi:hypothetical protein